MKSKDSSAASHAVTESVKAAHFVLCVENVAAVATH